MQKITNDLKFTAGSLLEFMVLKMLLNRTYSIKEIINDLATVGFKPPMGSFYPLMLRFRQSDLVTSGYEESETGSAMRTYQLTEKGRSHLATLRSDWKRLNAVIASLG